MKPELYHLWLCPYSEKVRNFITENNLEEHIVYRDVHDDSVAAEKLLELTGGEQVPCLVINDQAILESDDIIDWVKNHMLGSGTHDSIR